MTRIKNTKDFLFLFDALLHNITHLDQLMINVVSAIYVDIISELRSSSVWSKVNTEPAMGKK
jgi:CII-binding regulator of phage lambda lysogenization HflD